MKNLRALRSAFVAALAIASVPLVAHHEPLAKFDDKKPVRIRGVVTLVDWRNPHAHVFVNVAGTERVTNWAVELESPIELEGSGWARTNLQPGDKVAVEGLAARDGSRQIWAKTVIDSAGRVLFVVNRTPPPMPLAPQPTPRWPDGQPRLGALAGGVQGYWGFPSATALVESGVNAPMDEWGLLKNVSDAPKVAPMQPWALQIYKERQQRFLRDDDVSELQTAGWSAPVPARMVCSSWRTASGSASSCSSAAATTTTASSTPTDAAIRARSEGMTKSVVLRPGGRQVGRQHVNR